MTCKCGEAMVKESGCVNEQYVAGNVILGQPLPRRTRPATFWSCYVCGECEEVGG